MSWVFAVVGAQLLYAATNFSDKFLVEKKVNNLFLLSAISGCLTCVVGVLILLIGGIGILNAPTVVVLLIAGTSAVIANIPYYKALQLDDTSRIIPFFQFAPVIVLITSYLFLGEVLSRNQLISFIIIFCGAIILAVEKWDRTILKIRRSFWYIILATVLFSTPTVLMKFVLSRNGDFWSTFGWGIRGWGIRCPSPFLF